MKMVRCRDHGFECDFEAKGETEEEVLKKAAEHVQTMHDVQVTPELAQQVRAGTDGLLIVRGRNSGVLLPQVPIEEGWNREQFLAGACLKAGLPADAWQQPQTEIYRFSAQVFGEEEHGHGRGSERER